MRFSEQGRRELGQGQSYGSDGVLTDDRIRKALTRSLGASTGTATAEEADLLKMFEYQARQSERQEAFKKLLENISETDQTRNELEQISSASQQLELSSARLQDTKQSLDRAITGIRNASQQVKEINEPKRSYGMNFGR